MLDNSLCATYNSGRHQPSRMTCEHRQGNRNDSVVSQPCIEALLGKGDPRGLNPQHLKKIELILDMLEDATSPEDMNLARLDFHKLSGENPSRWSVHVNGNWCVTFSFEGDDATAVDCEDYH